MSLIPRKFYLDSVFDDFLLDNNYPNDMKCDIYEEDGKYNIILDIPGFSKEEIKLECHEGYIIVTAEKNKEKEKNERNYIKKERIYGSIQRQFYVGDINQEEIKAEFKNGILKVIVPKEESKPEKKQIVIE